MKMLLLAAFLLPAASAVQAPPPDGFSEPSPGISRMPNLLDDSGPGCRTIAQQIRDETKRTRGDHVRTLDREPSAHLLLAVDRQVGGCREVTFVRRNVGAPPGPEPDRR
ncbi:MAG TPA: hypothetical protein VGB54_02195 [Allosphingosinicella sp.]|jgi:hypothetical protein